MACAGAPGRARRAAHRARGLAQRSPQRVPAGQSVGDRERERRRVGIDGAPVALAPCAQQAGHQPRPARGERQAGRRADQERPGGEGQARAREQQPSALGSRGIAPLTTELRRANAELAAGAGTDDALVAVRARVGSARLDTVVAACLLQRRAGGDLARLLRESARTMEEQSRLEGELRAATAQARFTGVLVVTLPLGGALLAELASPGWAAGLVSSFVTAWLVGIALFLQVLAAILIRRLGRAEA